ncbi:hypothetical protein KC973_02915 [Candidatus Saccharibacteria bacterium]|nr:hypothetical protein [Candidatus Saccharibacteria bacterium]
MEGAITERAETDSAFGEQFTALIEQIIQQDTGVDRTFGRSTMIGLPNADYRPLIVAQEVMQSVTDQTGTSQNFEPFPDTTLPPSLEWFTSAERNADDFLSTVHFYTIDELDGVQRIDGVPTLSPTNDQFEMEFMDPRNGTVHRESDASYAQDKNNLIAFILAELENPDIVDYRRSWSRDTEDDGPVPLIDIDILGVSITEEYSAEHGYNKSYSITFYNGITLAIGVDGISCFDTEDNEIELDSFDAQYSVSEYLESLQRFPVLAGEVND